MLSYFNSILMLRVIKKVFDFKFKQNVPYTYSKFLVFYKITLFEIKEPTGDFLEMIGSNFHILTLNMCSVHFVYYKIEILLLVNLVIIMLVSAFCRKYYRKEDIAYLNWFSVSIILGAVFFLLCDFSSKLLLTGILFNSAIVIDSYTSYTKIIMVLLSVIILVSSYNQLVGIKRVQSDLPIIFGFIVFFIMVLLSAFNMITLFLSLEGLSLLLYVLAAHPFNMQSLEACLKYLFLGTLSGGVLLLGILTLYFEIGTFDYLYIRVFLSSSLLPSSFGVINFSITAITLSFFFKLGLFPMHMWSIDVYDGTSLVATSLFMIVVKVGVFFTFSRIMYYLLIFNIDIWFLLAMIGALGSLLIGSIGSLTQNKLKRLFAYTSLVQMGFVVLCFIGGTVEALQGAYFFFLVYTISMLGVFIIMLNTESFITGRSLLYVTDLKDFSKYNFWIGVLFSIMMFSQAGIPPLAGFFSKFIVFKYLVISGYYYLAIYCIIISAIASFAYIRVVKAMFSDKSKRQKYIYDCFLFFNNSHILNRGYTKNHGDNFWVSIFIKAVIFLVSAVLILIPIVLDSSLALTGKLAEDTICVVSK